MMPQTNKVIRVLASTRTDLVKARLIIKAVPGELDHEILSNLGADYEVRQSETEDMLEGAIKRVEEMIELLGGRP